MDAYSATRMLIMSEVPQGDLVRPVVAHESEKEFQNDVIQGQAHGVQAQVDRLAIAFRHRFFVPDSSMTHVERLHRAADLARNPDFREVRSALYRWQEDMVVRGYTDKQALAEMEELLAQYQKVMKKVKWNRVIRYGIFAASLAIPGFKELKLLEGWGAYRFEAGLKSVEFAHKSMESGIPHHLAPAAMVYSLQKEIGLGTAAKG